MNETTIRLVRSRAGERCEYCRLPERLAMSSFQVDHVIARKHRGLTSPENLALACLSCNSFKGPNIAGIDPVSARIIRLYHPRKERWKAHFEWDGPFLVGLTRIGRGTIEVLEINNPFSVMLRQELIDEENFE